MRRRNSARLQLALAAGLVLSMATPRVHAAPADSEDFSSDAARSYYEAGVANFDAGDYEGALVELEASLEIETQVRTLYAKAQSLNKLGRCRDAVPAYNRVLEMLPKDSPARPAVKDALVICAEQMAAEDAEASNALVEEPPQDAEESKPERRRKNTWYKDPYAPVMLGLGLAGVGVGAYYLSEGFKLNPENAPTYGGFEGVHERRRDNFIRGGVIGGVGAALVIGGIVRYIVVATREPKDVPSGQTARVVLDGVGVGSVRLRF